MSKSLTPEQVKHVTGLLEDYIRECNYSIEDLGAPSGDMVQYHQERKAEAEKALSYFK